MDPVDKPLKTVHVELPQTLRYFAKDHPGWRFAVVVWKGVVVMVLAGIAAWAKMG